MDTTASDITIAPSQRIGWFRRLLGHTVFKLYGWKLDGGRPNIRKAVVIAAPHTSGWDLPFTVATSYVMGVKMSFVAKHTLFKPPFGWFIRWLGGLPVDRRSRNNTVDSIVDVLNAHDDLMLVISPEGTRSLTDRWKTGFYHIAVGAKVPIVLGFLDYRRKRGGLGEVFHPSGDMEKDLAQIKAFYAGIEGKHPHLASEIKLRDSELPAASVASLEEPSAGG